MARPFNRKEGVLNWTPGNQERLQLSRNYHMQYLMVELEMTHDNAAGADFKDEAIFSLINQVEIVANGNENLKQIPGHKLYINNVLNTGEQGINKIDKTEGAGKVSKVTALINFNMFNTVRPYDTILNTAVFTTFDLLINWGSDVNLGTGVTIKSAKAKVSSSSLVGYKRNDKETIKYYKETAILEEITSTTSEYTITLPVKKIYKSIAVVGMVNGKRNDSLIKGVKIKSGTTVISELDASTIRAANNFEYKPKDADFLKAMYITNFLTRGMLSDALNTMTNFNTLEVVLDVEKQAGGTNNVYIYSDTVQDTNILEK